eukprot:CAMPEP_0181111084 /NCGR_PEP_ID=MMETSP1071-20121207/19076_1 /TAXON_ID=35127 /ORGANISM="Thalassiosira sp., Strain NH16" /LENGTH=183 /DNA_ID=CAMNT_0023194933 /DNA_START=91 /DNA_END=642 /DNA_ORIENTATION=+
MTMRKLRLPPMSFRRKSKEVAARPRPSKTEYEFRVTANPKERIDELPSARNESFETVATDETDNNTVGAPATSDSKGWGWLLSTCLGGTYEGSATAALNDGRSFQASYDGTGESSVPSMSRLDQVLELNNKTKADDISDITSAASIDDDDDDSNSENKTIYSRDASDHQALKKGNNCVWWSAG